MPNLQKSLPALTHHFHHQKSPCMHLLRKKSLLFSLCFFTYSCLLAQEKTDTVKTSQHELGLNVTGLITNLIGSNTQTNVEKLGLIAFLRTLSDPVYTTEARFSDPFK